jgi:hypothetical protein
LSSWSVRWAAPERQDPLVLPDPPVLSGLLDRKEKLVPLVWRVRKVTQVQQGHRVWTVRRVSRGLRVRMGNRVLRVQMEP